MYLEKFNSLPLAKKILIIILALACILIIYTGWQFINHNIRPSLTQEYYSSEYPMMGLAENSRSIDMGIAPVAAPVKNSYQTDTVLPTTATDQAKIIKTGNLQITVADVEESVNKISAETSASGGFIQNSSVTENTQGLKSASLVLRVPANNFENLISKIKTGAKLVNREDINGREVTEEYTDLQATLKHNEAVEAQYLELLKQANEVEEIIAVRDKLDQVQGEIERLKGRLRYLDNQTEMSTISVYITSEVKVSLPTDKWQPWENTKESARQLIANLQNFIDWLIKTIFQLIALIPYLIVLLIAYLIVKRIYKKMKAKQSIK